MEKDYKPLTSSSPPPHVLFFPLPFQGPVNCMLKLAELFCLNGFHVTFLNTEYMHRRLVSYTDVGRRFKRYPNLRFATVSDGLSEDNPRTGDQLLILLDSMEAVSKPLFREIVISGSRGEIPLTCIIVDGAFFYAVDMAEEIGIPLLFFDTMSPCSLWTLLSLPKLIEAGDFPFQDDDLDSPVSSVPGMEGLLRRRDLPSFCRASGIDDPIIQAILKEGPQISRARGLIFNSFEDLEGSVLSQMATLGPEVYAIGPVHSQLKTRLAETTTAQLPEILSNSIWRENKSCISWLDLQPSKSVLYFSIGSLAVMTKEQLMEIWYGLVNSGVCFLWVQREGSVTKLYEDSNIPEELSEGTNKRGCIVSWAPQEEVLAHPAVGGFLTHSGWNSTLESMVEGVPMICWPYYADQQVNSRYVGKIWKVGLDMKDACDRAIVEMMVRDLMVVRKKEFLQRAEHKAELAKSSVRKGGSSYNDLNRLIEDIKLMSMEPKVMGLKLLSS